MGSNQSILSTFSGLLGLCAPVDYQILKRSTQNLPAYSEAYSSVGPEPCSLKIHRVWVSFLLHVSPFSPRLFSMKVAFLVNITSARRVGELGVMMVDPPYTIFHNDKVSLCLKPKFTPKVVSECHHNQLIHLPVSFPKLHISAEERRLHSLSVWRGLAFYLHRIKPMRKSLRLFCCYSRKNQETCHFLP